MSRGRYPAQRRQRVWDKTGREACDDGMTTPSLGVATHIN